jgi:glucose/mannose-6-phosphate isomerase
MHLDLKTIDKIDSSKMYQTYDKWPEIAEKQFNANIELISDCNPEHIVFAGMGGSGAIGDLFSSILSKTNIHVDVVKGYLLPKTTDQNSLVICTSISGNTIEILTVIDQAKKIGCKIISFSDGGIMEKISKEKNIDYRKIPSFHSPRASFTSFLYSMLRVLNPVLPINDSDIIESIIEMKSLQKLIWSKNLSETNLALKLATWLPKIPVIYYPAGLESAAIRFKNSLQENSKIHVISEDVIEACHNGIVAWKQGDEFKPILIRGKEDYIKTQERWETLKEFFEKENIEFKEIFSVEGSILTKLINLIYIFDYTSIYKAVLNSTDPTPVEPINFIKQKL